MVGIKGRSGRKKKYTKNTIVKSVRLRPEALIVIQRLEILLGSTFSNVINEMILFNGLGEEKFTEYKTKEMARKINSMRSRLEELRLINESIKNMDKEDGT